MEKHVCVLQTFSWAFPFKAALYYSLVWFQDYDIASLTLLIDTFTVCLCNICMDRILLPQALRCLRQKTNEFNSRSVMYEMFTMLGAMAVSRGLPMASALVQAPGSKPSE